MPPRFFQARNGPIGQWRKLQQTVDESCVPVRWAQSWGVASHVPKSVKLLHGLCLPEWRIGPVQIHYGVRQWNYGFHGREGGRTVCCRPMLPSSPLFPLPSWLVLLSFFSLLFQGGKQLSPEFLASLFVCTSDVMDHVSYAVRIGRITSTYVLLGWSFSQPGLAR